MTWKDFWKKSIFGFAIKNILAAIVVMAILIWLTFRGVNKYTEHGVSEMVPDLRGAYVEEAEVLLKAQGLYPQVIDSVYMRDKKLGTIVEQKPKPNSRVKRNRPVYLIVNSREIRMMTLPAINDFSSRQAESMLNANRITVESIEYVPSEYKDLVIDVKYKGEIAKAGDKIPQGESVILVVGRGLGTEELVVPALKGMGLEEARREIIDASFILGATYYDKGDADESLYFIYRQEPEDEELVPSGTKINVWLTTDEELLKIKNKKTQTNIQDEEFF